MEQIRKIIQKVLKESFGVHEPTDELAIWLPEHLIANMNYYHEKGTINFVDDFVKLQFNPPNEIIKKTLINQIKVNINISNQGNLNSIISGKFETNETKRVVSNNMFVYNIEIKINFNWDFETDISALLISFFEHELHHAFTHIIKLNKKSRTKYLNRVASMPVYGLDKMEENNPAIKDFMEHFYLALPEEVNARVQEAYSDIQEHKNKPTEDLMKELYKKRAMLDAKAMLNYKSHQILSLPTEVLDNFINQFNANVKLAIQQINNKAIKDKEPLYSNNSIKYPKTEPKAFFEFWRKRINREGDKLFYKIIKMTGSAKNLENENIEAMFSIDPDLLTETIGVSYDYFGVVEKDYLKF